MPCRVKIIFPATLTSWWPRPCAQGGVEFFRSKAGTAAWETAGLPAITAALGRGPTGRRCTGSRDSRGEHSVVRAASADTSPSAWPRPPNRLAETNDATGHRSCSGPSSSDAATAPTLAPPRTLPSGARRCSAAGWKNPATAPTTCGSRPHRRAPSHRRSLPRSSRLRAASRC